MQAWRLSTRRHAESLDGGGNRDTGARWNFGRGRGVVYASCNAATAILETFAHLGPRMRLLLPKSLVLVELAVPNNAGILELTLKDIPHDADRRRTDGRTWYQRRGDQWLATGKDLVLLAPSIVSPRDCNVMLNPAHSRMKDVAIVSIEPFCFDPRLASIDPA